MLVFRGITSPCPPPPQPLENKCCACFFRGRGGGLIATIHNPSKTSSTTVDFYHKQSKHIFLRFIAQLREEYKKIPRFIILLCLFLLKIKRFCLIWAYILKVSLCYSLDIVHRVLPLIFITVFTTKPTFLTCEIVIYQEIQSKINVYNATIY